MKATVSKKGQVTIPKPVRESMGIRAGQVLEVREERGCIVLTKHMPRPDAFDRLFGILKLSRRTDDIIRELRGDEYPVKQSRSKAIVTSFPRKRESTSPVFTISI